MALPRWYDQRKNNNRLSREQESKRAREKGGRTRRGSGSSWRQPQDNINEHELEQIKFTANKSYSLKPSELKAVLNDALRAGREPSFVIEFSRDNIRAVVTIEQV